MSKRVCIDASIPARCMTAPGPDPRDEVLAAIAARAAASDGMDGDLSHDIAALHDAGWLVSCLPFTHRGQGWGCAPQGVAGAFAALRDLGRANLSVARLFEGHMNAVKLVVLYGREDAQQRLARSVHAGELLGVWGADDPDSPLTLLNQPAGIMLGGAKRFASGLGLVRQAVVAINGEQGALLALAPANDPSRCDPSSWNVSGMRATRSGRYDFTGVELADDAVLGELGDYSREPHFEGGIWRYCAAHCGGAEALFAHFREALLERGRIEDPHQLDRIATGAIALETMRLWLWRAAKAVETRDAKPDTATLSLLARQVTEDNCRTVLALVERGLGMAAHEEGTTIERIRRDLGLFLCQAQPDAKRQRAAQALAGCGLRAEDL